MHYNIMDEISKISTDASNRIKEINYMFTKINLETGISDKIDDTRDKNQAENPTDKYFLARSIVVFTYATLEKFVKTTCEKTLGIILEHNYFNDNYVKELMQILKYKSDSKTIFDLLMHHKEIIESKQKFSISIDRGYFSRSSRIDAETIAHIINVLNLNGKEKNIKIPKITIDTITKKRMNLAHGDYLNELARFGPSRDNLSINEVNEYINEEFKLNDKTREEIVTFINDFKNKIIELLTEVDVFIQYK